MNVIGIVGIVLIVLVFALIIGCGFFEIEPDYDDNGDVVSWYDP